MQKTKTPKPPKRALTYSETEVIADGILTDYEHRRDHLRPLIALIETINLLAQKQDLVAIQDICDTVNNKLIAETMTSEEVTGYRIGILNTVFNEITGGAA